MFEIGSDFWKVDLDNSINSKFIQFESDYKLLMSGRTSIDYVLSNIEDSKKIVYMPDYCCKSMIEPFIDNGYKIKYYKCDIISNTYYINTDCDCSIFFAISYFGFKESNMDIFIRKFAKRNVIIIEDVTHRFLSSNNFCSNSTYLICSLRKWFPIISGGLAVNLKGKFSIGLDEYRTNETFIEIKKNAMKLKRKYIEGEYFNKDKILNLYSNCNDMISNYHNMKIDKESLNILNHLNIDRIKKIRIDNYKVIYKKLKNNKKIKMLYDYSKGDCPLFVPIIINDREKIRKQLIDSQIYLPIHWPNFNNFENKIYEMELSLVNDQRYNVNDIEKYIDKLIEFVGD